jgi:tetratricopeptide (TPR) repeat protein
MAAHEQLDTPRRPEARRVNLRIIAGLAGLLLFLSATESSAQQTPQADDSLAAAQKLYSEKKWEEAIRAASASATESPELDYLRGMSLVHLDRWQEARDAFSAGLQKAPQDSRFLVERAGAEYRLKDFSSAKKDLLKALRLDPKDDYAREFLGTIYLLEGNLEAALKYWNRIEKPRLESVALDPKPHLQAKLTSQAVAFNAPQVLSERAWLMTDARLRNLSVFPQIRLELTPAEGDAYLATLHLNERNGWGNSSWAGVISLLSGVPYQTAYPEWYNLGRRAINFSSLVRWDPEKRRVFASLNSPVESRADRVVSFFVDARNENWNLSETSSGLLSPVTDLNLRRLEGGAELRFVVNGNWNWTAGAGVIGRRFQNISAGLPANVAPFFTNSTSMEAWLGTGHTLLRVPERRFSLQGNFESRFGRGFKDELGPFGSLGGSLCGKWMPHARGDDDEVQFQIRGSNLFGEVPLDQLFELGMDRDSTLWLRGHRATTDGRKGRAPLGRRYVLINSEYDKMVYNGGFFRIQAGPFLDTGKITDASGIFGDPRWLIDTGLQLKLRVLGVVSVAVSYGRDLRNGQGTFFGTTR